MKNANSKNLFLGLKMAIENTSIVVVHALRVNTINTPLFLIISNMITAVNTMKDF
jgi:hypothetical protein